MAAGFDSRAIRLSSEPRALDLQVQTTRLSAAPMYALSNNGTLVYAKPAAGRRLVWIDRSGREEYVKTDERMFRSSGCRRTARGSRPAWRDARLGLVDLQCRTGRSFTA